MKSHTKVVRVKSHHSPYIKKTSIVVYNGYHKNMFESLDMKAITLPFCNKALSDNSKLR